MSLLPLLPSLPLSPFPPPVQTIPPALNLPLLQLFPKTLDRVANAPPLSAQLNRGGGGHQVVFDKVETEAGSGTGLTAAAVD